MHWWLCNLKKGSSSMKAFAKPAKSLINVKVYQASKNTNSDIAFFVQNPDWWIPGERKSQIGTNTQCLKISGNTVWPQVPGFQKFVRLVNFDIFYELLSTKNLNVACIACNVQWDFFCEF